MTLSGTEPLGLRVKHRNVARVDHGGPSGEWRRGMAKAAVFLARPADEGVPAVVR